MHLAPLYLVHAPGVETIYRHRRGDLEHPQAIFGTLRHASAFSLLITSSVARVLNWPFNFGEFYLSVFLATHLCNCGLLSQSKKTKIDFLLV